MPERSAAKARERRDYERTASIISGALTVVGSSDLAMRGLTTAVKRTAKSAQQQIIADWLKEYTAPGHPGNTFFKNIRHLHPNVRKRFVAGMMANFFMRDPEYTASLLEERGISSPTAILISPSMRCNLRCVGCYAAEYDDEDELTEDEVENIINQGEEIGSRVFVMLGGEPFVWRPLLDIIERHPAVGLHGVHQRHHDQRPRGRPDRRTGQHLPDDQHRRRPRGHRRPPWRRHLRPHHGGHGPSARARRHGRLLRHRHQPEHRRHHLRRVRRSHGREGLLLRLVLLVHARGTRPRSEPHAQSRAARSAAPRCHAHPEHPAPPGGRLLG